MDKILSARIDDSKLRVLDELSKRLHKSKKSILEEAIEQYARDKKDEGFEILKETSGCWNRKESASETAEKVRGRFSESFSRHRNEGPQ